MGSSSVSGAGLISHWGDNLVSLLGFIGVLSFGIVVAGLSVTIGIRWLKSASMSAGGVSFSEGESGKYDEYFEPFEGD